MLKSTKGKAVFKKERIIFNEAQIDSSLQAVKNKMDALLAFLPKTSEMDKDDPYTDSLKLLPQRFNEKRIQLDPRATATDTVMYFHKFKDSHILHYVMTNGELTGFYRAISLSKEEYTLALDSLLLHKVVDKIPFAMGESRGFDIDEVDFEDKKVIKGYPCFKVRASAYVPYGAAVPNFEATTTSLEMYVTEDISYGYHPVIESLDILEFYYPMEIIERHPMIKGFYTRYSLEEITLR